MKRKDEMRRWRPRMLLGVALALAIGALVLAGCGSGGSGSSSESTTASAGSSGSSGGSTSGSGGEAGGPAKFEISEEARSCLKEKGVELPEMGAGGEPPQGGENGEMPNPPEGGEGTPPAAGMAPGGEGGEKMQKAFEECGVETPEFKGGPGGEGGPNVNSAAFKKQVREYVACVKENGYELGEPNFSGEGPIFEKTESESTAFKEASAKCEGLLGGPSRGGGSSGESSSGEAESS
ncbi:MAG: hypothetical protein JST59_05180 [Actinobacteria bacterium]|nr:hypothetical protein [Actinomycetota bacterium]